MKTLVLALISAFAFGSHSFASSITIDGLKPQYKAQTKAEVTHTEYTEEERDSTCSRQVQVGSHESCSTVGGGQDCHYEGGGQDCHEVGGGQECHVVGGGQSCHTEGGGQECGETPSGRQCYDVPGHEVCESNPGHEECNQAPGHQECSQAPSHQECTSNPGNQVCESRPGHEECEEVPTYETQYYACKETVQVPHVITDSQLQNDIIVNVDLSKNLPQGLKEVIELVQTPDALTLASTKSTAKVLIYATQTQTVISDTGKLKKLATVIAIKMIDRNLALGAFLAPLSDITADSKSMQLTMGPVLDPAAIRFDVEIKRKKFLGKDEMVLQRSIQGNEVTFANTSDQSVVTFDFSKLGIQDKLSGKKVHISLILQSNLAFDGLVNRQDIPEGIGANKELDKKME